MDWSTELSRSINEKKIVEVPLKEISKIDINPRKGGLIMENIENLIKSNGDFPEIYLGYLDGQLIIIDGWHRFTATQKMELPTINAFIIEFNNLDEMKFEAFKLNVNHGIKLSDLDIALNIYDFYINAIQKDPATTLKSVIEKCGIKDRRGRMLFYYTVVNKEILGVTPTEITNFSIYEEYIKVINKNGEIIGKFSEEFKRKFKNFIDRYGKLQKSELRIAINDFLEGKDYYEEQEKSAALVEEMNKKDREKKSEEVEVISKDDMIDRTGIKTSKVANPVIEELENEQNEMVKEEKSNNTKEVKETNNSKNIILDPFITSIKDNLKKIKFYIGKDLTEVTKENYTELNNLVDIICDIINDCGVNQE